MASQEGNRIDLMTLPPQQLAQLKEQLEQQIEQFSMNFQDLQNAISGFHSSGLAIEDLSRQKEGERVSENRADAIRCDAPCASHLSRTPTTTLPTFGGRHNRLAHRTFLFFFSFSLSLSLGKDVLIPLTSSLYVGGTLGNPDNVMVDIGTGYYVEKTAEGGRDYCKRKVMILTKALEDLAEIIKAKRQQVQQCQRVLQMKMQQFQQQEQQGASV